MSPKSLRFYTLIGLLTGLLAGFLSGLGGVGGGVLMIPMMTALGRLSQHEAHGTSLVAIIFAGLAGTITYLVNDAVDWSVSLLLAAAAMLTTNAGARYAHSLPELKLRKAFGLFVLFVSLMMFMKGWVLHAVFTSHGWQKILILSVSGVFAGFISGLMGVGGAVFMIPSMVLLVGMTQQVAQGTCLLAMVFIGASSAFAHYRLGNVHKPIVGGLVAGAIVGVFAGGTLANTIPESALRVIFATMGIIVGVRFMRSKGLRQRRLMQ